jgi:thiamine-phosphate diphosphorylase
VTICLVTDRHRLGATAGTDAVVDQARAAVAAGIDLIQIRERDLEASALAALAAKVVEAARGSSTRVVVNDRLDIAIAVGAAGVHLRADSVPVAAARRLAPKPFLVGRSVHSVDEARAAADADYLIAGTVFPSGSKPGATLWLGVDGLAAIVRAAAVPVLGIGGATLDRLDDLVSAGASGVAAIGMFVETGTAPLGDVIRAARLRFDSLRVAP